MTNWRAMPADEAADLAGALHTLDWSWTLDDAPAVVEKFGWHASSSRPRRITLDTGLGPDTGTIRAKNGEVTGIELQLTDFADAGANTEVSAAFDRIAAAISGKLGEPSARVAGPPLQYRWAGPAATVLLERSAASVWLYLVTNARLAADDRNIALDEQGLL
ncbi:DUF6301 family protein [Nocardia mangyaensis]|uniref:DUF6301 family protein n=1 Tax=Nocardia mangyaensis TaxID=2213200 RepID=UPI002674A195|nr:DUF6301 family protein [Nocardia mangyaensis]MDO3647298.1 DUF6301 family protein [Nocardia mangyaensis]